MVWPEASAALAAQEQLFRTLANSIPQLAWMADDQGSTFWYNQRWYDFTGTSFADMQAGKQQDLAYVLGAADYIVKPIDREQLRRLLQAFNVKPPHAKIMVVDDDPDLRAVLRQVLEREGCEVCEAGDGRQALDLLDLSRPNMILFDLIMPGIDGFEFSKIVRRNPAWNTIPLVVITSRDLSLEERIIRKDESAPSDLVRDNCCIRCRNDTQVTVHPKPWSNGASLVGG